MVNEQKVYTARLTGNVAKFISELPEETRAKIKAQMNLMETNQFDGIHIKTLRKKIKELIIQKNRFIFFTDGKIIYFIDAFVKKTQKTPKYIIDSAEDTYKRIIQ